MSKMVLLAVVTLALGLCMLFVLAFVPRSLLLDMLLIFIGGVVVAIQAIANSVVNGGAAPGRKRI